MTEEEWANSNDPDALIECIRDRKNSRMKFKKSRIRLLRLMGCACCNKLRSVVSSNAIDRGIEVAELYADGEKLTRERDDAYHRLNQFHLKILRDRNSNYESESAAGSAVAGLLEHVRYFDEALAASAISSALRSLALANLDNFETEQTYQSNLIRDIFGNPFSPAKIERRWRTSDVVAVARGIYESRAFDKMPILADALMDAGCEDDLIISHCKSDGPHVRGCWVVDSVLGKA